MVDIAFSDDALWDRIERAVEKVKVRMRRVALALDTAGIAYAVVGGNAVQMWVARVDETAIRTTRDVDIVLNRSDLPAAILVLESVGFLFNEVAGVSMFLDGPLATPRDGVHLIFANEKLRQPVGKNVPENLLRA